MLLFAVTYLAGILTILSPCILPVLPFVFARSNEPFVKSGLPLLLGMALTFMLVASLASVGGGWVVKVNQVGRFGALVLLGVFGLTLLIPRFSEWITRPLVALGSRLSNTQPSEIPHGASFKASLTLGVATGLLWSPCAGPILGLILTGAALEGASVRTSLLLLAYGAGAATSLGAALLVGGRVFSLMKRSLAAGEWIRRGLGAALLIGVAAISLGLDTGVLARLSTGGTSVLEESIIKSVRPSEGHAGEIAANGFLPDEGPFPSLDGAVDWLNSQALSNEGLKGKVVLIDFWTYSCVNCLRSLPFTRAWAAKYKDKGLVVIGVHSPEFAFERNIDNVRNATKSLKIDYPVAIDNDLALWRNFGNAYWPAEYLVDTHGRVRYHHFGEGDYGHSEQVIQQLLGEAGQNLADTKPVAIEANGASVSADTAHLASEETYVGYERGVNFASPGGVEKDKAHAYVLPVQLSLNQWGVQGAWKLAPQYARLEKSDGRMAYRFHARDLNLVMGTRSDGQPVRFRVLIDGRPPGVDHGADTDQAGTGTVDAQRLYQLVRQASPVIDRTFEIFFLDPGVEAFAFTFG